MITVNLNFEDDIVIYDGVWQWDEGLTLKLEGVDLEKEIEVHFGNKTTNPAIVKSVVDGVVEVPNILLEEPYDIEAWVFVDNETTKGIFIHVQKRPKPSDFVSTAESKNELEDCKVELEAVDVALDGIIDMQNSYIEGGDVV